MQWTIIDQRSVLKTIPFEVEELHLRDERSGDIQHPYHRLKCHDWVNVLAVTHQGEAVLIKQSRAGVLADVLETPGGMVDPKEKDTMMAALRELEEETGYTSQRVLPLGSINPNPALFNNRLHMFLALGCHINPQRRHFPDQGECIETQLIPVTELERMVKWGEINSCLCALTVMMALPYLKA